MNRNGIDIELLHGTIESVREHPEAGAVAVRTRQRWDDGFAVDGRIEEMEQAGEITRRTHTFRTDWPEPYGGNTGPTPGLESIVAAVGACVATTYVAKAALRGVRIDALEVSVEGRVDLQGHFELDSAPARFSDITVTVGVRSERGDAVLADLGKTTALTSPAYDSLAHPVSIGLSVQRLS